MENKNFANRLFDAVYRLLYGLRPAADPAIELSRTFNTYFWVMVIVIAVIAAVSTVIGIGLIEAVKAIA